MSGRPGQHGERGMSLVAALFLIVILAALSVFAVRIGASGEQDVMATLLQARALAAARSGVEYGAYRALVSSSCNGAGGATFNLTLTQGALSGFSVTVTCVGSNHLDAGVPYWTYEITAAARRGTYGSADYVARTVTKTLSNGPP